MELLLLRHAQPLWIDKGLCVDNPPLTDLGFRQAELLGKRMAREHLDHIYVSPLLRTRQTAEPILRELKRDQVIEPWLEEIRSPIWHGSPGERASAAYKEERLRPGRERWHGLEGGEPVKDFVARIHAGAEKFLSDRGIYRIEHELPIWQIENPGERIACVAHAGTNSTIICHLLGLTPTPWEWERFVLGHASITRLEALKIGDGYVFALSPLSDLEHIPSDDRTN
ncbi:MAG: histidine phosphatase family protein [Actinobacteria bacterium]|nr:MAG: histidine phosphatase family protein [Actinomycetota bacterium]